MGRTRSVNKYDLNLIDEHGKYGVGYCSNTNNKFYFDMDDYDKIKDIYCSNNISMLLVTTLTFVIPIDRFMPMPTVRTCLRTICF